MAWTKEVAQRTASHMIQPAVEATTIFKSMVERWERKRSRAV